MVDGFILVIPLLLMFIVLLFTFTGCAATLSGSPNLFFRATIIHEGWPPPHTAYVAFSWMIERDDGELIPGYGYVEEPVNDNGIDVYDLIPLPQQAGYWTVWCSRYLYVEEAVIPGEMGPESGCQFLYDGQRMTVTFEIVRDGEGGWLVQAAPGSGCQ